MPTLSRAVPGAQAACMQPVRPGRTTWPGALGETARSAVPPPVAGVVPANSAVPPAGPAGAAGETEPTGTLAAFVGSAVHRAIPIALARALDPADPDAMLALSRELTCGERLDSRRARVLIASMTTRYLRTYRPPSPWRLIGSEVGLGDGRTDLQWLLDRTDGVPMWLIDELKTGSILHVRSDERVRRQRRRYVAGAQAAHPDRRIFVRIVALGPPSGVLFAEQLQDATGGEPWVTGARAA